MSERALLKPETMTGTQLDPVEYAVVSQALMAAGRERHRSAAPGSGGASIRR